MSATLVKLVPKASTPIDPPLATELAYTAIQSCVAVMRDAVDRAALVREAFPIYLQLELIENEITALKEYTAERVNLLLGGM